MRNVFHIWTRAFIFILGVCTLVFLLWEPHVEGRNAGATFFAVYTHDAFLLYAYVASLPFFYALFQVWKLIGYAEQRALHSPASLQALRIISYCSALTIILAAAPVTYLVIVRPGDDIAGGVFMGSMVMLLALVGLGTSRWLAQRLRLHHT